MFWLDFRLRRGISAWPRYRLRLWINYRRRIYISQYRRRYFLSHPQKSPHWAGSGFGVRREGAALERVQRRRRAVVSSVESREGRAETKSPAVRGF